MTSDATPHRVPDATGAPVVEVFADVGCPFTHVGLAELVEERRRRDQELPRLWVRSWPLEVINARPLDAAFIAEEVDDLRQQVSPGRFAHFHAGAFPQSTIPAMTLTAAAYAVDLATGEAVALAVREALFEAGLDVGDPDVLAEVATDHGLTWPLAAAHAQAASDTVGSDLAEGRSRGVVGSPHFFARAGTGGTDGFFCPTLEVGRDDAGHLHVDFDPVSFGAFVEECLDLGT